MSQGRKIFRFLKFLDELKTIQNFLKTTNKPLILKVLITLRHVSSFFYYILDNTLWGVKTGVLKYFYSLLIFTYFLVNMLSITLIKNGNIKKTGFLYSEIFYN